MSDKTINFTDAAFDQEVLHSDVPVLVDFWAPWCGPCRMLSPVVDEIATAKLGKAKVGKVNIDNEVELAARFRVNAIPALLYFKGGEVRDQVVGGVAKATLISKLDALG